MLHFDPDARLEFFCLVDHGVGLVLFVERTALARTHGHMPGYPRLGIRALFDSLVPRITKGNRFLPVQQGVSFSDTHPKRLGALHRLKWPRVRSAEPQASANPANGEAAARRIADLIKNGYLNDQLATTDRGVTLKRMPV